MADEQGHRRPTHPNGLPFADAIRFGNIVPRAATAFAGRSLQRLRGVKAGFRFSPRALW